MPTTSPSQDLSLRSHDLASGVARFFGTSGPRPSFSPWRVRFVTTAGTYGGRVGRARGGYDVAGLGELSTQKMCVGGLYIRRPLRFWQ